MKHFLRTHAMDKPRCLFSSVADQTELTTNSSISMITNRLINAGYSEWNRMCWNWAPRWAIPTMKLWAEQDTCSPFSVFKEHQGEKGSDGGRVCLFCKTATYSIHCAWYCSPGSYPRTSRLSATVLFESGVRKTLASPGELPYFLLSGNKIPHLIFMLVLPWTPGNSAEFAFNYIINLGFYSPSPHRVKDKPQRYRSSVGFMPLLSE